MKSPRECIEEKLRDVLARELPGAAIPTGLVKPCQDLKHGDFQSNAAMVLGKANGKNPRALAESIAAALGSNELFAQPEIAGPGFLNFKLRTEVFADQINRRAFDGRLGLDPVSSPETIVFDFSGPNIAKEMHVGHIRSTILGDCLARLHRFMGHKVITDNHLGDWGTQFGMVILGYKRGGDAQKLADDPFGHLETLYKGVQEECKTNEATLQLARQELVKLQQGDVENRALWEKFIELSKSAIDLIYKRLGVHFDHTLGESSYNPRLNPVVEELLRLGIARESEGAVAVFSDGKTPQKQDPFLVTDKEREGGFRDNPFLIRKSDGAALYGTTDLATVEFRSKEWGANRSVYVTDARQQMHFGQLFATVKRWGLPIQLDHVWFGSILGEDKTPLKTREGKPVKLRALLDEAESRSFDIVTAKRADWEESKRRAVARVVGLGALKYADLAQNRNLDYVFNCDKLLAFDGNTAPYLQNAYVRIRSIFRKAGAEAPQPEKIVLTEAEEIGLARQLIAFGDAVHIAAGEFRPHHLCGYLFDLATAFHKFYEACPVLKVEGTPRETRLVLCHATARTLQKGLELLGIETVEEM